MGSAACNLVRSVGRSGRLRERNALLDQVIPLPASEQLSVASALADHPKPTLRALALTVTKMALAKLEDGLEAPKR